jgi:hypothetical protein
LHVVDHPIAANGDWTKTIQDAKSAKPQAGWQPIVLVGEHVLVAVREMPARQVWIGFESPEFSHSSDFVIFWTNVLDWVGHGGDAYVANGPFAVPIPPLIQTDWKNKLRALPAVDRAGFEAATPLLVGAVLLILVASVVFGTCKSGRAG